MKHATQDRGPPVAPGASAEIHTSERLSANRSRLPNGNLLCRNVPVGRVGWLIYGPGEVPVKPGDNGVSYVERTADTLFEASTLGSIIGAAITFDHPADDVTPKNWSRLAGGYAINAKRGEGADSDVILADLMITDKRTIDAIESGLVEVSLGYDADYLDQGGGLGKQFNIIVNHIAMVSKGRCGPRCAIGDSVFQPNHEGRQMPTQRVKIRGTRRTLDNDTGLEAARQRVADAEAELATLEGGADEEEGTHVHIHMDGEQAAPTRDAAITALETRMDGMEATNVEIRDLLQAMVTRDAGIDASGGPAGAKTTKAAATGDEGNADGSDDNEDESDEEGDSKGEGSAGDMTNDNKKKKKTGDSAALATNYTNLLAQAEVLVPGFKVPTFDAAMARVKTIDRMCAVRRKVLDTAYGTPEGKVLIDGVNAGQPFDCIGVDCNAVAVVFKAAAAAKMVANNSAATRDAAHVATPAGEQKPKGPMTPAEINAANRAFWENKKQ